MAYESRKEVLARLRALYESGTPIVGTGAGTGLTARAERDGHRAARHDPENGKQIKLLQLYISERSGFLPAPFF